MVTSRELDIVQMKTAQSRSHRLEMQPVVDEAKVLLDLRVADVVPVADRRVIESLEEKIPVRVDRDFLEVLANLDSQLDAAHGGLLGDPFKHLVREVAVFDLGLFPLQLCLLAEFLVLGRVLFSRLEQVDQLVGVIPHVDLTHVQHDQLGPELIRHLDGFHRVLVGVLPLANVGGGKLEHVWVGVLAPDRQWAEVVQGGNLDHARLVRVDDSRHETEPNAMAQLGILKPKVANLLEHRATVGVAVGIPAGGKRIHFQKNSRKPPR